MTSNPAALLYQGFVSGALPHVHQCLRWTCQLLSTLPGKEEFMQSPIFLQWLFSESDVNLVPEVKRRVGDASRNEEFTLLPSGCL